MTLVPWDENVAPNHMAQLQTPTPLPEEQNTWGAAFRQENSVVSALQAASRPAFPPDPEFDLASRLEQFPEFASDPEPFYAVGSDAEFDYVAERRLQELRDRQLLEANGLAGIGQMMAAGMLSPTLLLPGGAVVRTARAGRLGVNLGQTAVNTAGWAAVGASIDEGILYMTQDMRTGQESMLGISSAVVLGALFGAGAGLLTRRQISDFEASMASAQSATTIQPYQVNGDSLSAARAPEEELQDPGGTLNVGLDRVITFLSPVQRNLNQEFSPTVRRIQAQLNTGGLYLRGNIDGVASARGGEISSLRNQHYHGLYTVRQAERSIWNEYRRTVNPANRMTRKEFYENVGRTLSGQEAVNPQIQQLAEMYREQVFQPMLREAQATGMRGFDNISEEFAQNYFPRVWRRGMLEKDKGDVQDMLTEHFEEQLMSQFERQYSRLNNSLENDAETLELLSLSPERADEELANTQTAIDELPEQFPDVQELVDEIRDLRAEARGRRDEEARAMRARATELSRANKERLAEFNSAERSLRGRISTLTRTAAGFERRQAQVIGRIDRIEEQQTATAERAIRSANRALERLRRGEDRMDATMTRLRGQIERAYRTFERGEMQLDSMRELPEGFEHLVQSDPRSSDAISRGESRQEVRAEALEELIDQLNELESGRPQAELALKIEEQIQNLTATLNRVNNKRALRLEQQRTKARALDPEQNTRMRTELEQRMRRRRLEFVERLQTDRGAEIQGARTDPTGTRFAERGEGRTFEEVNLPDVVNFQRIARQMAEDTFAAMTGENKRISAVGQRAERGSELARTLDIDETRQWSNGRTFDELLDRDVERVSRHYLRNMATDVELQRAFGSVNPLAEDSPVMKQAKTEFEEAYRAIGEDENLTPAQKEKQQKRLADQWQQALTDLDIQVQRLRYTRGVPDDPEALGYRLGRFAMNLNVLRLMGGVVISSLPDLGSVIMRHGLTNVFRDGLVPMITNFKTFKMSTKEAKLAGTSLDVALHSRMAAMFDIMDEVEHGTMLERATQHATNKFGLIVGMDHYNAGMKSFASALINARMVRAIERVAGGRGVRDDVPYLAANGIDAVDAARMWAEITNGRGGSNVNGVALPNTIDWEDQALSRAYRAALGRQVEMEIVTPGTERPNWMDQNMYARLLAQFRSFTFSATQRIIISSAQEARLGNYVPVMTGVMTSLGMAAASYYLWSVARGREVSDDPNVWANEMVNRSGLLGVLGEVKNVSEEIPQLRELATLGANQSTRSDFANPAGRIFGPTVGLASDTSRAVTSFGEERGVNALRRLLPYQNFSAMAWFFDAMQEQANDLLP